MDLQSRAVELDQQDQLAHFRDKFHFPTIKENIIYLNGNSLGLQPKLTREYILKELDEWQKYGVEGHFEGDTPWLPFHELLTPSLTRLTGTEENEVVAMNTLTANLHFLMVSFYKPTSKKYKILVEYSPFPSDIYAVQSQVKYHGFEPEDAIIQLHPDKGEIVSLNQIEKVITEHKDELALVMMAGVNYYTGQTYDMKYITELSHKFDIPVGFDLAHAVGNIPLKLHEWGVDFAVFCTYKYLNSGPGSVGGAFIHNKYITKDLHRFAGWWGQDKKTRFLMKDEFIPIPGVEGWQLSNPPILSLAAIRAALHVFDEAGFDTLIQKSKALVSFARECLRQLSDDIEILTPDDELSGAQLSIVVKKDAKKIHKSLNNKGVVCDWREPNVIRVAFAPLYNNFQDVIGFTELLTSLVRNL